MQSFYCAEQLSCVLQLSVIIAEGAEPAMRVMCPFTHMNINEHKQQIFIFIIIIFIYNKIIIIKLNNITLCV